MEHIKLKIEELIKTKPSNVLSIAYGYKSINGKQTDELCIIYGVDKKKSISKVSALDFIPSTIVIDEQILKTDVIEIGEIKVAACNPACGQVNGPSSEVNRNFTRPLKGGLGITNFGIPTVYPGYIQPYNTTGTMGFIAVNENDCLVGVTCNHIAILFQFMSSDCNNVSGTPINILRWLRPIYQGDVSWQLSGPSTWYFSNPNPLSTIGSAMRYVPLRLPPLLNQVDAALIILSQNDIDMTNPSTSVMQVGETYTAALPFATTAELDNLLISNPMLYSSGAATGPKGGSTCPLRIFSLLTTATLPYINIGSTPELENLDFTNLFQVCKPVVDPVLTPYCGVALADFDLWATGDSGSAVIADFGGVRKIIGMMMAFDSSGLAYCCRIDNIATQLNISAWDGTNKSFIDPLSLNYRTILGGQPNKIETCSDGNDYWQVGLSDLSYYPEDPC